MGTFESLYYNNRAQNMNNALKLFGKKLEDLDQDITILKEWLKGQRHLPEIPSDYTLTNILFLNKFSIEKSKENIDMYYSLRPVLAEVFVNKNPKLPHMKFVAEHMRCGTMPGLTPEGYRVNICKLEKMSTDDFSPYDLAGHCFNMFEIRLLQDLMIGDIYIIDMANYSFAHITKITPVHLKKLFTTTEKVFKSLLKRMHIINVTPYVENLVALIKQIVKVKLAERIMVHQSADDLKNYLPIELLPIEYGGKEYSLDQINDMWLKQIDKMQYRFDELDNLKVDEGKRPAPLINDDFLGFHGNFKKLNVD